MHCGTGAGYPKIRLKKADVYCKPEKTVSKVKRLLKYIFQCFQSNFFFLNIQHSMLVFTTCARTHFYLQLVRKYLSQHN